MVALEIYFEEPWMEDGACRTTDPRLFFPERGESTKEAKAICKLCAVREDCLEYADRNNIKHGIWGGIAERERRRQRRQRLQAKALLDGTD